jgi:hypothetical protein
VQNGGVSARLLIRISMPVLAVAAVLWLGGPHEAAAAAITGAVILAVDRFVVLPRMRGR